MKLVPKSSPYIRKNVSVKRMMLDVIIALIPVVLFAIFTNGWNGIYVLLISVVTMLVLEWVSIAMMKWPKDLKFKEIAKILNKPLSTVLSKYNRAIKKLKKIMKGE